MSGSECCSNPPTLDPTVGSGHVENLHGFDTYLSGSLASNLSVLLISDVFGYEAPNLRKLADKIAAAGFFVAVPDFFSNDPYCHEDASRPISAWIKDHGTDKGFEDAKVMVEALTRKGISAVGAAGFCWGAKVVVELAKVEFIDAAVLLHPSLVTVDDIKDIKVPISILGAETDPISPPELVKRFDEILKGQSEIDYFVKIFPGVAHGWTVRYDTEDPTACERAEEAHRNLLEWVVKYVKGTNMASL